MGGYAIRRRWFPSRWSAGRGALARPGARRPSNGIPLLSRAPLPPSSFAVVRWLSLFRGDTTYRAREMTRKMERKMIMTWNERNILLVFCFFVTSITLTSTYDPNDKSLKDILLPEGQFEAFYLKGMQEEEQNAVRPPHLHGSFHQYRNPALVDAPNSAAYGFRFDGKRRFNFS
ncbi:uncharacterized protein [Temnothorax longispinosus]